MAGPSTKLPAQVPAGRAPVAAAAAKAAARPESTASGLGTFKLLVWMLIVLNVAAGGGWLWFKFFKNAEERTKLELNRKRLVTLKSNLDLLQSTVRGISDNNVNEVSDPGELVGEIAASAGIRAYLDIEKVREQKFHKTSYQEKVVAVRFLNQRGYQFADIVRFLAALESANPTVQIKEVNFGTRHPPTVGTDNWRADSATVRTLQLSSPGGS